MMFQDVARDAFPDMSIESSKNMVGQSSPVAVGGHAVFVSLSSVSVARMIVQRATGLEHWALILGRSGPVAQLVRARA